MAPLLDVVTPNAGWLAATLNLLAPWTHLYRHATALRAAVTYAHLIGILLGGGVAVATDRAALQLSPTLPDWRRELDRLAEVHRWVVGGLALIFASGLLMMLADVETFAQSAVFWIKIGLVALLLGNGYVRLRAEIALRQGSAVGWSRFRQTSIASLVLWLLVLLAGALLHTVA
jgi:hypothetical protein